MGAFRRAPGCGCCGGCANCSGTVPDEYELTVSGFSNAPFGCTDCSSVDGTFTLTYIGENEDGDCIWEYDLSLSTWCSWNDVVWRVVAELNGSTYQLRAVLYDSSASFEIYGYTFHSSMSKDDCNDYSSTNPTGGSNPDNLGFSTCTAPATSGITLTAL